MKLELNNSGAWKTVLSGLQPGLTLDRAMTAATILSECDGPKQRRAGLRWRLVSEGDGKVVQHGDSEGWTPPTTRTEIQAP